MGQLKSIYPNEFGAFDEVPIFYSTPLEKQPIGQKKGLSCNNYVYDEEGRLIKDVQEGISNITWRVDGKVKAITMKSGSTKKNLTFDYDAMGHRIAKHILNNSNVLEKSTYYVLDAQGNVMSTYEREIDSPKIYFTQKEKFIYGSSRVGVLRDSIGLLGSQNATYSQATWYHVIGKRNYELTNHLGNVLTVISDKPLPHDNGSGSVDYFLAEILQASDYSPFGVTLSNRNFTKSNAKDFRYGFQNQEEDDEIKGEGNSLNYTFRMHDPRLGRFFAIDPLTTGYPWNSPYAFSENRVIDAVELEGLEKWLVTNYRSAKTGLIIFTSYELYKGTTAEAGMVLGQGILYQERTKLNEKIDDTQAGSAKTTHIDNSTSTFQNMSDANNHGNAMQAVADAFKSVQDYKNNYNKSSKTIETILEKSLVSDISNPPGNAMARYDLDWKGSWKWNFENDKSDVLTGSPTEIQQMQDDIKWIGQLLLNNPGLTLTIEGHTSTQADADYNLKLSQARADYIRTKILASMPNGGKGYEKYLIAIGYGETKPIIANDATEADQNVNRRTEIKYTNNGTY